MTDDVFRFWVAICAALGALATIVQVALIFGIYKTARGINQRAEALQGRAESALDAMKQMVEENRPKIADITAQAAEVVASAKVQMNRVDAFLADATEQAKVQMDRVDAIMLDTMGKVQETTAVVQSTILKPVREVNGVMSGLRAALSAYSKSARTPVDSATQDEEMFI
jgi:hypothetical protein